MEMMSSVTEACKLGGMAAATSRIRDAASNASITSRPNPLSAGQISYRVKMEKKNAKDTDMQHGKYHNICTQGEPALHRP